MNRVHGDVMGFLEVEPGFDIECENVVVAVAMAVGIVLCRVRLIWFVFDACPNVV